MEYNLSKWISTALWNQNQIISLNSIYYYVLIFFLLNKMLMMIDFNVRILSKAFKIIFYTNYIISSRKKQKNIWVEY